MNHVWFFRFFHTLTSLFTNPVSAVETQQYHNVWAILFTCRKTGPYYYCMICLLIKIFHLFSTKTIKFLRLPNFFYLEKLSICFNIFIPRLKKPHPATPKKLMIEYPVAEVTLRHWFCTRVVFYTYGPP